MKSARVVIEGFFVRTKRKNEDVLCVLRGFCAAVLAEKHRQTPMTHFIIAGAIKKELTFG